MKKVHFFALCSVFFVFATCKKNKLSQQISLSDQYIVDGLGNLVSGNLSDGQWKNKAFTQAELALFSSLDTADLTGTTKPDSINQRYFTSIYPNPSLAQGSFMFSTHFNGGYSGKVIMKYVIVDSTMNVLYKGSTRIQAQSYPPPSISTGTSIAFMPNTGAGRFRFYFTYSALSNPHFFRSWGNIQRRN